METVDRKVFLVRVEGVRPDQLKSDIGGIGKRDSISKQMVTWQDHTQQFKSYVKSPSERTSWFESRVLHRLKNKMRALEELVNSANKNQSWSDKMGNSKLKYFV